MKVTNPFAHVIEQAFGSQGWGSDFLGFAVPVHVQMHPGVSLGCPTIFRPPRGHVLRHLSAILADLSSTSKLAIQRHTMRRPYREQGKPFAVRTVELLQGLQLIADSLQKVRKGEIRYLTVLSGQLRSLVAERSKGEVPLLLDVAEKFGKDLTVHCMPGVDDPTFPEEIRKDLVLQVAGFPVTLERQFPEQREMRLPDLLDEDFILFRGTSYSPRNIIEWYANKGGGAHYSSRIPEDFAALMSLNLMNMQPLANLLLQIGEATVAAGRQLLKSVVDFEIYALVVVPVQETGAVQDVNYLFDSQYEGSGMRISLTLNSRLMPSFFVSGLQGVSARVDCDRMVNWSEPRLLHATLLIEDDFSTTIELALDGVRVGRGSVKVPLFVFSDPLDYDTYLNRATDGLLNCPGNRGGSLL